MKTEDPACHKTWRSEERKKNHEGRNQYDACLRLPVYYQKLGDMGQTLPYNLRKEPIMPPPQTSSL